MQIDRFLTTYQRSKALKARHVVLGDQVGVALLPRGANDPHVLILLVSEDDGQWFDLDKSVSSYWLPDLQDVLARTTEWLKQNCDPDTGKDGRVWGWRFREVT